MADQKRTRLEVIGMHCSTCPEHVERALRRVPGVQDVHIPGWESNAAEVIAAPEVSDEELLNAVRDAGYQPRIKDSRILAAQAADELSDLSTAHNK